MGPPTGKLESCSNNIIVWLGSAQYGSYPYDFSQINQQFNNCFEINTDKSVWDNAVAEWKIKHGYNL
jgi:hypothetical protein